MIIEKDAKISNVVRIRGAADGPRAVIFSGVHGDEVSGIHAVEKLLFDLFVGTRELLRGSLTLVRGNEQAIAAERRYLKLNLNRMYKDEYPADIDRNCYEFKRSQELKSILREGCDYFFDLHSAPTAGAPFIVVEEFAVPFYAKIGIPKLMTGWSKFSSGAIGGDGENYANTHGAKSATFESGSHFDKRSNDVAYKSVVSFLTLLEMIAGPAPQPSAELEVVDVYKVILKEAEDFRYAGIVDNFKFIGKGQPFAYQNGRPMMVDQDTYLLIPMKPEDTKIREEVCYLGRKVAVP
jgi:succinylglutamate desuccinylase